MGSSVTVKEIRAAAAQIHDSIVDTPCVPSRRLSEITGADVRLKLENLQSTGSFKVRGALLKMLSLTPKERQRGVVAMSAGNHAQAVAFHAQRLGIPAMIVMPRFTPSVKQKQTRGPEHVQEIVAALERAGYLASVKGGSRA